MNQSTRRRRSYTQKRKTEMVNFSAPPEFFDALDQLQEHWELDSTSATIRKLIREGIKNVLPDFELGSIREPDRAQRKRR